MIAKLKENRVSRTYWGGASIDRLYAKESPENTLFPEDWTASTVCAYNATAGKEEGYGKTVDGQRIIDLVGNVSLPILVKLLDSAERLVIQAHPTVPFAQEYLNSPFGKTECWYFLDCAPDACVYFGFKEGVTREDWERTFHENDSERMLEMLHRLPVKKGDFIFVGGGMPHAIGAGCFMIELQEPSDLMVVNERFTPSGREIPEKRLTMGLSYEKMFDVYDYTGYALEELKERFCPKQKVIADGIDEILGADLTDKFRMLRLCSGAVWQQAAPYRVAIVTDGEGQINGLPVKKGDRLFIYEEQAVNVNGNDSFEIILCE